MRESEPSLSRSEALSATDIGNLWRRDDEARRNQRPQDRIDTSAEQL
jgi:hypothetical protein